MTEPSKYYRHREHDMVIRIVKDTGGVVSVCVDDPEATVFHMTKAELDFNFAPTEEPDSGGTEPISKEETQT